MSESNEPQNLLDFDLRDRIAAAICRATSAGKLFPWHTLTEREKDAWRAMADAVIRELDDMGIIHLSKVRHDDE